jgi:hypothetical protein
LALEVLAGEIETVVLVAVVAITALGLAGLAFAASLRWVRRRRSSKLEVLFVGRWGDHGPELFRIGKDVRRLSSPEIDSVAVAFSEQLLAEVMRCRPARRLTQAFADAQVDPLPDDGFVLSAFDIEAWLETRGGGEPSEIAASRRWGGPGAY